MPALLKGWFDRVWLPGMAFRLGGAMALKPLLTGIHRIVIVTTYGSPWWVGWPDRRLVKRGFRQLCASDCRVEWLALTRMDVDSPDPRVRFIAKVASRLSGWR